VEAYRAPCFDIIVLIIDLLGAYLALLALTTWLNSNPLTATGVMGTNQGLLLAT